MIINKGHWSESVGVFDLETTGIDVATSRIVSANVSMLDGDGNIVSRTDWLADPGIPIPEQASNIHGITTARAQAEGRPSLEVVTEISAALRTVFATGAAVVVYNAPYDLSLLRHEALRHGIEPIAAPRPVIDPLVIDKAVDRYRKGKRTLDVVAAHYGVELLDAHDASSDAIAAGRVAQALARRYPEALSLDVAELHDMQVGWCSTQAQSFQTYMRTKKGRLDFTASGEWPLRM
ncbi:3'-5' exonuclease [Paramicrobacterium fandaimingii]|uniref:3'-5' exonuclease n=1 Tax=Paramicrobacterium fandaimingii TaxID=2708079 RepID=UPI001F488A94|nr:3'-5' exonuclease [Microbacterium fandaimingii]